jgi:predicted adenine nucleotide alpha hydrolase (AANH) superfamily ATPase
MILKYITAFFSNLSEHKEYHLRHTELDKTLSKICITYFHTAFVGCIH